MEAVQKLVICMQLVIHSCIYLIVLKLQKAALCFRALFEWVVARAEFLVGGERKSPYLIPDLHVSKQIILF